MHAKCNEKTQFVVPCSSVVEINTRLTCFPKVRHRTKLHLQPPPVVIPSIHHIQRIRRLLLVAELGIHVSHHMIAQIIANVQRLQHAELGQLLEEILEEAQEVLGRLGLVDGYGIGAPSLERGLQFRLARGMSVGVFDQYGLGEGGTIVNSGASVGVSAGANFEVEGTVDLVFFGAVDAC